MYSVSTTTSFNSAHRLKDYKGKCENLHGHNWSVKITVVAKELDPLGMVIDFTVLKAKTKGFINYFDHVYLNELPEFADINPTSENLALVLFKKTAEVINDDRVKVKSVTVWETENNCATYEEE